MRPRNIVLLAALLLGAVWTARAQRDTVLVEWGHVDYYADGVRLATEERYEEAVEQFRKALELTPDHDPSHFELSRALATLHRTGEADSHSARAVELDPGNQWYREQRGRLLISLDRLPEATEVFEWIVADHGEFDPDNYRMLAVLYYKQNRTDDALATLAAAEVQMGTTPELIDMRRGLLIEAGRIDEAAAVTEQYIARTPYDEANRIVLAQIYNHQGRDSLGMETLRRVIEINPDNAEALTMLGDAYRAKGQDKLYLATLRQLFTLPSVPLARKREMLDMLTGNINFYRAHYPEIGELALSLVMGYPGDASTVELYADHASRGGDREGALTILKGRLSRPDAPLSTFMKTIQIEAWSERIDSVRRWSDRALGRYPDAMDVYLLRAGVEQYLKHYKDAHKTLQAALKVAATDSLRSEVWGAIGTLWHEEGNNKKTFASYEKSLAYGTNNALVLNNYAYFLSVEGRQLDRALGMAQRAVRLRPGIPSYLDTYAWVLYKTGDLAEAKKTMQQALALDREGNPELMIHYGDILWALGEEFMASVYWKKARDAGWEPAAEIEERLGRIKR